MSEAKEAEEQRREIYRRMTPAEKLAAAEDLYFTALALKEAHFRKQHPEWSDDQIEQKAKDWMMYART